MTDTTKIELNDSTRRSLRTGIDLILGVLGSFAAVFVIPGVDEALKGTPLAGKFAIFSLIVTVLTVFLNKLKNSLEDAGTIPAVLKAPASDGADPVPESTPSPDNVNGSVQITGLMALSPVEQNDEISEGEVALLAADVKSAPDPYKVKGFTGRQDEVF